MNLPKLIQEITVDTKGYEKGFKKIIGVLNTAKEFMKVPFQSTNEFRDRVLGLEAAVKKLASTLNRTGFKAWQNDLSDLAKRAREARREFELMAKGSSPFMAKLGSKAPRFITSSGNFGDLEKYVKHLTDLDNQNEEKWQRKLAQKRSDRVRLDANQQTVENIARARAAKETARTNFQNLEKQQEDSQRKTYSLKIQRGIAERNANQKLQDDLAKQHEDSARKTLALTVRTGRAKIAAEEADRRATEAANEKSNRDSLRLNVRQGQRDLKDKEREEKRVQASLQRGMREQAAEEKRHANARQDNLNKMLHLSRAGGMAMKMFGDKGSLAFTQLGNRIGVGLASLGYFTGRINSLESLVTNVTAGVSTAIGFATAGLGSFIGKTVEAFSKGFGRITEGIGGLVTGMGNAFGTLLPIVGGLVSGIGTLVGGMISAVGSAFGGMLAAVGQLAGSIFGGIVEVAEKATRAIIESGVHMERVGITFGVLIGNIQKGKALFEDIQQLAIISPYTTRQLTDAGQLLLGMGISAKQLIPTLARLGDIAAGDADRLHRLALVFGEVEAEGRLTGYRIRQLASIGIGVGDLAETMGISRAKFRTFMKSDSIPGDILHRTVNRLTNPGGRFFGLGQESLKSVGGQWTQLGEVIERVMGKMGMAFLKNMSAAERIGGFANWINKQLGSLEDFAAKAGKIIGGVFDGIERVAANIAQRMGLPNLADINPQQIADNVFQGLTTVIDSVIEAFTDLIPVIENIVNRGQEIANKTIEAVSPWVSEKALFATNPDGSRKHPVMAGVASNIRNVGLGVKAVYENNPVALTGDLITEFARWNEAKQKSGAIDRRQESVTKNIALLREIEEGKTDYAKSLTPKAKELMIEDLKKVIPAWAFQKETPDARIQNVIGQAMNIGGGFMKNTLPWIKRFDAGKPIPGRMPGAEMGGRIWDLITKEGRETNDPVARRIMEKVGKEEMEGGPTALGKFRRAMQAMDNVEHGEDEGFRKWRREGLAKGGGAAQVVRAADLARRKMGMFDADVVDRGRVEAFQELKKSVGGGLLSSHLPTAAAYGSAEAFDTIAKTNADNISVMQQMLSVLQAAADVERQQLDLDRQQLQALQDIAVKNPEMLKQLGME